MVRFGQEREAGFGLATDAEVADRAIGVRPGFGEGIALVAGKEGRGQEGLGEPAGG